MEDVLVPVMVVGILFLGLPWLVFHYITQWKRNGSLSVEDEKLLDELHDTARRLEERLRTIERIIAADSPEFRPDFRPETRPIPPARDYDPRDREIN